MRRDQAVAQGTFKGDKAFDDSAFAYEEIGVHTKKHRRMLWWSTLFFLMCYVACAAVAHSNVSNTRDSINAAYAGTDTFFTDLQNALCSASDDVCTQGSVGDFVNDLEAVVDSKLDEVVVFLTGLEDLQAPFTDVSTASTSGKSAATTQISALNSIKTSATSCTTTFNTAAYARYQTGSTGNGLPFSLPTVTNAQLTTAATNQGIFDGLITASASASTQVYDLFIGPDSDTIALALTVDTIPGNEKNGDEDQRAPITKAADDIMSEILDLTKSVKDVQTGDLVDYEDMVSSNLDKVAMGVAAFIMIPAFTLLLFSGCAACRKSAKPFYFNMSIYYLIQGLFCLLGGIFLLVYKINGDVCTAHKQLLVENLDTTFDVNGVTSVPLGQAAVGMLQCDGKVNDPPTATNNMVAIFGINEAFDLTDELVPVQNTMKDQAAVFLTFIPTVSELSSAAANVTVTPIATPVKGDFNPTKAAADTNAVIATLPPATFDRSNNAQVLLFESAYMGPTATYATTNSPGMSFTWVTTVGGLGASYATQLTSLNNIFLNIMTASIPNWYNLDPAYAEFALAITYTSMKGAAWADDLRFCGGVLDNIFTADGTTFTNVKTGKVIYDATSYAQVANICTYGGGLVSKTATINTQDTANAAFVNAATALVTSITSMNTQINFLPDADNTTSTSAAAVTAGATAETTLLTAADVNLEAMADGVMDINLQAMMADRYTMCGFVGTFYESVYVNDVCSDVQVAFQGIAGPLIATACVLFLAFMTHGVLAPSLRKRPVPVSGEGSMNHLGSDYDEKDTQHLRAASETGDVILVDAVPSAPNTPLPEDIELTGGRWAVPPPAGQGVATPLSPQTPKQLLAKNI